MPFGFHPRFRNASLDRGTWLALLFVLLGILAPTAAVLWFMNEAARAQSQAAERSLAEAYRGQLRLVRDRINAPWQTRTEALASKANRGSSADFHRFVTSGLADSVIFLRGDKVIYPAPAAPLLDDSLSTNTAWTAAALLESQFQFQAAATSFAKIATSAADPQLAGRAAQAEVRCLLRSGQTDLVLRAILDRFSPPQANQATDIQGRIIAGDSLLLGATLAPAPSRGPFVTRLTNLLNDYDLSPMPASQRLFLMNELRILTGTHAPNFPTNNAEELAAHYLESNQDLRVGAGLERVRASGLWRLAPTSSGEIRAIALYRPSAVTEAANDVLKDLNSNAKSPTGPSFLLLPPGSAPLGESLPLGGLLPGWEVALEPGKVVPSGAPPVTTSYLWGGYMVVALLAITGLLLVETFRRQMRLSRLKTDLVAAASHELRTPLASMRLLVDSLLDDEYFDRQKTRDYLQLISSENLRLTRLVENFLTFSRIERNRQTFEFGFTHPSTVVSSAVDSVRERFAAEACRIETEIAPSLPTIRADQSAIVTVLINLLDNAFKYTPGDKHIAIRALAESGQVVLEVEDNGIGISPFHQKRIFRRFYQVDRRLSRDTGGCGLGLSIVHELVRAHGGRVTVTSQPGHGSTFRIWLPVSPTSTVEAAS